MRQRSPRHPALRPFVRTLWHGQAAGEGREWVLPTGSIHLVLRLGDAPLRIFEGGEAETVGTSVLGGPRERPYLRLRTSIDSVGAQLVPGAAPLFGLPAHELAGRHLPLGAIWGSEVEIVREAIAEAAPERRLDLFEDFLLRRLRGEALDPVVRFALARLTEGEDVGAIARATGYSHRHFLVRFRRGVGLLPSTVQRLLRFQRALRLHARGEASRWADLAQAAGYADQAHLSREFVRLAGMSPAAYARRVGRHPNHVDAER